MERAWKEEFPADWQERRHVAADGQIHIADVKTATGTVLEFQHSSISPNEQASREGFYGRMAWFVNGTRLKKDLSSFQAALAYARPSKEEVRYVVEIQGWDWGFWFGITNVPSGGHYDDYRHLEISGTFVAPHKYAGRSVELAFLPDRRLNNQGGGTYHIDSVGHLTLPRATSAICSMPSDALPAVLQMLIAERFRFVVFSGGAARYGQVDFRSFRFATTFDPQEDA